ncbi:MAG: hypothetical protein ACYS47_21800 [Planctomycetota bacterium]|jgi:hypothetical protein
MAARKLVVLLLYAISIGLFSDSTAFASQPGIEDVSRRDMVSRHYRLPDGSWQAVIFSGPRHYLDDTGRWVDIDRRLLQVGPGVYQNLANPLKSRFDGGGVHVFTRDNAGFRCVPLGIYSVSEAGVRSRLGGSRTAPKPGAESVEYAGLWGDESRTVFQILNGCLKERIILVERPDLEGMEDPVYVEFVTRLESLGGLTLLAGSHPVDGKGNKHMRVPSPPWTSMGNSYSVFRDPWRGRVSGRIPILRVEASPWPTWWSPFREGGTWRFGFPYPGSWPQTAGTP